METQINYKIQNINKEVVEKGYVNVESVVDDKPECTYAGESVHVDTYIFLHTIWNGRYGEKYEYEDNDYTITINPDEK